MVLGQHRLHLDSTSAWEDWRMEEEPAEEEPAGEEPAEQVSAVALFNRAVTNATSGSDDNNPMGMVKRACARHGSRTLTPRARVYRQVLRGGGQQATCQ